jgi:AraC family transcriptional regulator
MTHQEHPPTELQTGQENSRKHFLTGLQPGPPPDHMWHEYNDYSIYTAEQHRSIWQRHTHDCTQITIAMSPAQVRGEWEGTGGRFATREMSGDMIWLVPPGVLHRIHFDRRAALIHLYLTETFFGSMVQDAPDNTSSTLVPSLLVRDQFLVEIARELYRELHTSAANELFTQSIATLTATHLVRSYSSKRGSTPIYRGGLGPSREKKVRAYIRERLDQQLSLDELAKVAEMSPNYFISLFRQSIGMTPHKFVVQQRLEHARTLLENSRLSLLEIARHCGFQDQSQFTTTFRRFIGMTPGQYKRQI